MICINQFVFQTTQCITFGASLSLICSLRVATSLSNSSLAADKRPFSSTALFSLHCTSSCGRVRPLEALFAHFESQSTFFCQLKLGRRGRPPKNSYIVLEIFHIIYHMEKVRRQCTSSVSQLCGAVAPIFWRWI